MKSLTFIHSKITELAELFDGCFKIPSTKYSLCVIKSLIMFCATHKCVWGSKAGSDRTFQELSQSDLSPQPAACRTLCLFLRHFQSTVRRAPKLKATDLVNGDDSLYSDVAKGHNSK